MLNKFNNTKFILKLAFSLLTLFFVIVSGVAANSFDFLKFCDNNTLDIVQVSDVHLDTKAKRSNTRMLEYSQNLLKDAVLQINNLKDAQLVVFSGDVVNGPNKNEFLKFIEEANHLRIPWYYAPGNHDAGIFGGLSKPEILCILNKNLSYFKQNQLYYSYSPNNKFIILFLDGIIENSISANGYFPKEELKWLENQLKYNPNKKIIIVQHFPVVEPFKSATHKVSNAEEYLRIIDKYTNVIAILSGHYHAAKITQRNNVLHVSTPSLVEYPNAFREIKITSSENETKFELKFIETRLKEVQQISKTRSKNWELKHGKPSDRNAVIIIQNRNKT